MSELLEEYYTYINKLTLIKSIYGLVQSALFLFKEYIKKMTQKARLNQWNTDTCILYIVNELGTAIVIIYIYYTLEIGYKTPSMDTIECIKK